MTAPPLKVLIACHTHGTITAPAAQSYAMMLANLAAVGVPFGAALFVDSDVSRGRNQAAAAMLEGDFTHLFFWDADIEFGASDMLALLNLHRDVAVGPYRKKNDRDEYNFEFVPHSEGKVGVCSRTGALEVMRAGTGFMLIRRRVFEAMREALPNIAYQERRKDGTWRQVWTFFEFQIRETPWGRQQFSEDFNFCERWRELGGDLWMAPDLKLKHWGPHAWAGDLSKSLEIDMPASASSAA